MNEIVKSFREGIMKLDKAVRKMPNAILRKDFPNSFSLEHSFAKGLYIRKITVPAGVVTITEIHKYSHAVFLMKGKMSILEEDGIRTIEAPCNFITKAGTKRLIYHHNEVVIVTVHATEETDIEKIEEEIIAKSFDELDNVIEIEDFVKELKLCEAL